MKATMFLAMAMSLLVSVLVTGCSDSDAVSPLATDTLSSTITQAASPVASIRLLAKLEATKKDPLASGKAKWEKQSARIKFSVEAEDLKHNGKHRILVDGNEVGLLYVKDGIGDLNLDTALGHSIPAMKRGQLVEVFNPSNELVLKGTLSVQ